VKPQDIKPPQGATGRADLLRLLATTPSQYLILDDDGEQGLAYRQNATVSEESDTVQIHGTVSTPASPKPSNHKLPLQMPFVHVIAERQTRETSNRPQDSTEPVVVYNPISEADAEPPEKHRLIQYQDLVPKARLLPALKRYLSSSRSAGLDVPRLVKQIAGQQQMRHLPRRQLKTWHPQWVVVMDFAKRLRPYWQDMHQLAEHLIHACGQSGVSIRIINHGPLQHWTDWIEEQCMGGKLPTKHDWRMPPAKTPVLLVSDLGLLEGADSTNHQAWQDFIRQLSKAHTQPLALLPLGSEQLDEGLPNHLPLLRWSPDARIRPERALGKGQAIPDGIDDLLAMAAVTRRVDPPLLRAMRRLNPTAPLNAGLEGAFWRHADVEAGSAANIRQEAQAKHLHHFAQQLDGYHIALEQLRYSHHAHLRAVLNHEETLLWRAQVDLDDSELAPETLQRLAKADSFMRQLAATLKQPDGLQKAGVWWTVAQDLLNRTDQRMGERYADLFTPLVAAIAEACGDWRQLPDWVDPADLVGDDRKSQPCWLVREPVTGSIMLQLTPPASNQSALTEPLPIDKGGLRIESVGSRRLLSIQHLPYRLCGLQEEVLIKLTTSLETLTLASVNRPRGSMAWGCNTSGVWVRSPELCGQLFEWSTRSIQIEPLLKTVLAENGQYQLVDNNLTRQADPGDVETGYITYDYEGKTSSIVKFVLDEYGMRADLDLLTAPYAKAMQSFRWIEPGSFLMGSPDNEPERFLSEGPQHEVTISRGYWLADTACTQALWQAVMGDNPSRFKYDRDQQKPVETVSWYNVQKFLRRLQSVLPGCQVDLPSEAEWEYACRAGTITSFSFGPHNYTSQLNSFGFGYNGEFWLKTVAVKSFPANPWGLYEMHGNVDEWCKDGHRTYDQQAQVDPLGPITGDEVPRAVRGGSWSSSAESSRSAIRFATHPGDVKDDLGFRFCLRSIESGQGIGPAGSPGRASGASPDAVDIEVKSSEKNLFSKVGSLLKRKPKPKR
jgi:formylglycine-generating enzyme required for sulfatase activity